MNAVSLFAGVGGFDLALERNGIDVVASVEIDKHAQKILARHFPKSKLFTDVMEVTGEQLIEAGFTPKNGIVVGGFPCQDVSVAGRRAGLTRADGTHTRSGLFWEVVRILEETKARYFILENVPGLLSSNGGRDFGTVIGALDELGYGVSWRILDAQYFGVPQRRRRVFIVGCLGDSERAGEILALSEGRAGYLAKGEQKRKATARNVGASPVLAFSAGNSGNSYGIGLSENVTPPLRAGSSGTNQVPTIFPFTPSSFAQYEEDVGTLRSNGGDLGGAAKPYWRTSSPRL